MSAELDALLVAQGGVATTGQLLNILGRTAFEARVGNGTLTPVWTGIYSLAEPDPLIRLAGLDLRAGAPVPICLGTAAAAYGFDTEDTIDLHVLTPDGHQLRAGDGLIIHRRDGAPLSTVDGRSATEPAWTAIEVARTLRRPRALATLDAALRTGTCDLRALQDAADRQAGRRGIVHVRDLLPLASPLAASPMESESRLVMHDGGLPAPELQYEILDRSWRTWRVDFAWPAHRLAVEYDGFDWHSDPEAFRRDRQKRAALSEMRWTMLSIVGDDVRRRPDTLVRQIEVELMKRAA